MIRRPPRSTLDRSSAASDVYKRQQLLMNSPIIIDLNKEEFIPLEIVNLYDTVLLKNNPLWQQTVHAVSIAEAEKRMNYAERLPEFSLGYFIQSISGIQDINGQTREYNNVPRFQGFQVGINIPIFSEGGYKSKIQAAKYIQEIKISESDFYFNQIQNLSLIHISEPTRPY